MPARRRANQPEMPASPAGHSLSSEGQMQEGRGDQPEMPASPAGPWPSNERQRLAYDGEVVEDALRDRIYRFLRFG